ncbi:MAG: hypothetical protein MRERV_55c006 [Mycoplasmataceae bacterium RV_VA103A]|nr:MAG: hypothetical protein MRERV_55c006 [Mycoplasmataceae bacterium RV_VA103A]
MEFIYNSVANRLWHDGKEITQKGINKKEEKYFVLGPDNHWVSWQNNNQTIFYKKPANEGYVFYIKKNFPAKTGKK